LFTQHIVQTLTLNFQTIMTNQYLKPVMKRFITINRRLTILISCLLFFGFQAHAVTKRALFMAIDTYNPEGVESKSDRHWSNLEGCVNDAEEVKALVAAKYGFTDNKYITFIKNQECSRERILKELNKLIDESQSGDIVFIYYAGHGSQVYNSLSDEEDKMDESMVPADIWKGTKDIRDKELALLFNKLIDKGVILTVVYDSCHSGSIGRGPLTNKPAKIRKVDNDMEDAKDATRIAIAPEERGALIFSAAQDIECASEQQDEHGTPHGAFTIAFCRSLQALPATASATEIFTSVRAIMKYNGKTQEPVLAGNESRKSNTLFGIDRGTLPRTTLIAVMTPESGNSVTLQGGTAIGLAANCVLANTDKTIELTVTEVNSMTKSTAKVTKGDYKNIKPGDLYSVTQWVVAENALTVYIPISTLTYAQVKAAGEEFFKLKNDPKIEWIIDPSKVSATHTVFFNEGTWYIGTPDNKSHALGSNPKANDIKKFLVGNNIKLCISLPPYAGLLDEIEKHYKDNTSVKIVSSPANANYYLAGRVYNNQVQYAFIMPCINSNDSAYVSTMPIRTDFIQVNGSNDALHIDTLAEYTFVLAKIKIWLALSGPSDGASNFPFYLALKNSKTNRIITAGDVVDGETYGLVLVADKANIVNWDGSKRYVYVFSINADGSTKLFYGGMGVENKMPRLNDNNEVPDYMPLGRQPLFKVTSPYGVDTYVILTTDEPITNPEMLESKGVRSNDPQRGEAKGKKTWADMFANAGSTARGAGDIAPTNWSVVRVSVRSIAR
jgi:hypothetical protein